MSSSVVAFTFLTLLSSPAWAATLHPRFSVGQTVQTSNGPISGHAASPSSDVSEYLGIPFAQPPVGNLRFAPPVKYQGNGSTFDAKDFTQACASNSGHSLANSTAWPHNNEVVFGPNGVKIINQIIQADTPVSEDCLSLNVWTKPQTGEASKAVLVWIYGGGFVYGSTNVPFYQGQFLADREDVVVVTINYRTNIFGFSGAPNLVQNAGLLDQRLAIQWVRDNIASFGGDASRITIFGQSAGGASLDYYSLAYYDNDPIVNGFIQESGNAIQLPPASASDSAQSWYEVTSNVGCGDVTSNQTAVVACMRGKSVDTILAAVSSTSAAFGPTVDEITAFSDGVQRAADGKLIHKPMLIGNTNGEAGYVQTLIQASTGLFLPQAALDTFTLQLFTCPAGQATRDRINNGIPAWRYRWFGLFDNSVIAYDKPSGVYHASEIPYVFGSISELNGPADAPQEAALVQYVQGAWAAFAKDPQNGLVNYGWPRYDPTASTLVRLGFNNASGPNLASPATYDAACPVFDTISDARASATETLDALQEGLGALVNALLA